jgi:hypothetical protein
MNYFENLIKLIKYIDIESVKDSISKSKKINNYLKTLSLDKRKIAVGMDFLIWYFDVFSEDSHFWNVNPAYYYAANTHEFGFLTAKPETSLMTLPAFNTGLANLMNKRSKLTMLNNYQLDLFEQFIKTDEWHYDTITMQEIETNQGPTYDFICMSLHDVIHNPSVAVKFFDRLNKNGTLMMLYTGMDSLYQDESIFTDIYEVHQVLKDIDNSADYHTPTGAAVTYAVKL